MTCQDVLFSGHTVAGTVWSLFTWRYVKRSPLFRASVTSRISWTRVLSNILFSMWLIGGWFVIAASHFHYTVDVMVGALFSFEVYNHYHYLIDSIWIKRQSPYQFFLAMPLRWLEKHSLDLK